MTSPDLQPSPSAPPGPDDIRRYQANFRDEVDGAALYRMLADSEDDEGLAGIYRQLADAEDRHRALWERMLREAGAGIPSTRPSNRVRILGWLARRFGTGAVLPVIQQMEADATTMYDRQPEAIAEGLPAQERSHARVFREMSRSKSRTIDPGHIPIIEGRHRMASGNALRAAVLGANDGLVSNLSLVMAFAGANPGQSVVVLAGVGGLLAGAISMALGEWISVRSSAEAYDRQVAIERDELIHLPAEEQEELTLIYQAKGFSREEAQVAAARVMENPDTALDTLVREELGLSPDEVGNPWVAAIASFLTFASGAILPVLPWFFIAGWPAIILSAIFSGLGLFGVGAAITLFTGRGMAYSGARMLLFGLAAAVITYAIGTAIGVGADIG